MMEMFVGKSVVLCIPWDKEDGDKPEDYDQLLACVFVEGNSAGVVYTVDGEPDRYLFYPWHRISEIFFNGKG